MILHLNEPIGEKHRALVDYAFKVCDSFMLVTHRQSAHSPNYIEYDILVQELNDSLITTKEQYVWPGTMSSGLALVHYFQTTDSAKEIIMNKADRLFDWCYPDMPEDLCFMKGKDVWLASTAHEGTCYIKTDVSEEIKMISNMPGLVKLIRDIN